MKKSCAMRWEMEPLSDEYGVMVRAKSLSVLKIQTTVQRIRTKLFQGEGHVGHEVDVDNSNNLIDIQHDS